MSTTAKVRSCSFNSVTGERTEIMNGYDRFERIEEIDLLDNILFVGLKDPLSIAEKYESFWNDIGSSNEVVRVIEVIIE